MEFITLAKERYSCRKLSDRKVDRELTDRIVEAGLSAPTACNYQPFRIWVMESEDALNRIRSLDDYQTHLVRSYVDRPDDSVIIVVLFNQGGHGTADADSI